MECFSLLLKHLAWIEDQFLSDIRDSKKARSLSGMMRGVRGVRKSIHQSWLAKCLGLGLLCWGFKGVQQEIPSEEASTLQISGISTRTIHQSTTPSLSQTIRPRWALRQFLSLLIVHTLLPVTFGYTLSSEAPPALGAIPQAFTPFRGKVYCLAPEAPPKRGMPTGSKVFLAMPDACGLRPCARNNLKNGLVSYSCVGGTYDK